MRLYGRQLYGANCPNNSRELINVDAPNWGSHQRPDDASPVLYLQIIWLVGAARGFPPVMFQSP